MKIPNQRNSTPIEQTSAINPNKGAKIITKGKIIKENMETAILSESSLKKDWYRPEEDKAWQNL